VALDDILYANLIKTLQGNTEFNPRGLRWLEIRKNATGQFERGFFKDPWDNNYWIALDLDYDGQIGPDPTHGPFEKVYGSAAVWSCGPDGKNDRGRFDKNKEADDINRWGHSQTQSEAPQTSLVMPRGDPKLAARLTELKQRARAEFLKQAEKTFRTSIRRRDQCSADELIVLLRVNHAYWSRSRVVFVSVGPGRQSQSVFCTVGTLKGTWHKEEHRVPSNFEEFISDLEAAGVLDISSPTPERKQRAGRWLYHGHTYALFMNVRGEYREYFGTNLPPDRDENLAKMLRVIRVIEQHLGIRLLENYGSGEDPTERPGQSLPCTWPTQPRSQQDAAPWASSPDDDVPGGDNHTVKPGKP